MAFALAVGDLCSPFAISALASSTEPPVLGVVTKIGPTVVVWQDGREQTFTTSSPVDQGLSKVVTLNPTSPFMNARVTVPIIPNPDGRANGTVVIVVTITNVSVTDLEVAIIRFDNGLYTAIPTAALKIIPGA